MTLRSLPSNQNGALVDLGDYTARIVRRWYVVLGGILAGLALAFAYVSLVPPKYVSSMSYFVDSTEDPKSLLQSDQFAQSRANSYVLVATSDKLAERVRVATKLPLSAREIANATSASVQANTVVITLDVASSDAETSMTLAKALDTQFAFEVSALDPVVTLHVLSSPRITSTGAASRKPVYYGLGALLGLVVGVALAARAPRRRRGGSPAQPAPEPAAAAPVTEVSLSERLGTASRQPRTRGAVNVPAYEDGAATTAPAPVDDPS